MQEFHPHIHHGKPRVGVVRSLVKTIGYRVISVTSTTLLAGAIFGDWTIAAGFGAVDAIANTVLYFLHERAWAHIDLHIEKRNGRLVL
jgi:uncharacterized membrane protein